MAFRLFTMSRETSSSTGSGDMVMGGAQTGYFAFSAEMANGDTTWLTFKAGSDEETGRYTYNSGANSFTRTKILKSTNAGLAVTWIAGTKDVICGLPGFSDLDATELGLFLGIITAAPSARLVSAAGLATGGGDLTADRTITVTAAVQSDQETATSTSTIVTPGRQHFHPSALKASGQASQVGTQSLTTSYNVASITDTGVGLTKFNFTTSFSSANFQTATTANAASVNFHGQNSENTGFFEIVCALSGTGADTSLASFLAAGDFA